MKIKHIALILALALCFLTVGCSKTDGDKNSQTPSNSSSQTENSSVQNSGVANEMTLAQLSAFNGKDGQPAYIAVDGIVYDVSACFTNGAHNGFDAGNDLTANFYSEHSKTMLTDCPVVGTLKIEGSSDGTVIEPNSQAATGDKKGYISADKAKEVALSHGKFTKDQVTKLEAKLGKEGKTIVYEVEFNVGKIEYEYDIDATTGKVLESKTENDD